MAKIKVGRNDPCPCGRIKKYKHCCKGRTDWNRIFRSNEDRIQYLSPRGRNICFLNRLGEILQLDSNQIRGIADYKKAFTADAVRDIHEAVVEAWPRDTDLSAVLAPTADEVSSLYIGDYTPEYLSRAIVRQSIYANKILIVDPFVYPFSMWDEFNPLLNPHEYRAQTLKNTNFWLSLMPWINAGIVELIRTPGDLDRKLNWESLQRQEKKFEENPDLKKALEDTVKELTSRHMDRTAMENLLLSAPDSYIRRTF